MPDTVDAQGRARLDRPAPTESVITDVKIPFLSMVVLLVKVALAAIPAALIIIAVVAFVLGVLGGYGTLLTQ